MSRRARAKKRIILPDPVYHDIVLAKFINRLMYAGQKSKAEKIVYTALSAMSEKVGIGAAEIVDAFKTIINNVRPLVEVKSRRVGGSNYQVPIEVASERGVTLAIRWLIHYSRLRVAPANSKKTMSDKLLAEFVDAYNGRGQSVKKREDVHKMAEANRAFVHFRWEKSRSATTTTTTTGGGATSSSFAAPAPTTTYINSAANASSAAMVRARI